MELWIRSQNKERIIKINQLDVMELDTDVDPRYNYFGIYANEYLVGEYKSKERALEVLDDIYSFVNNNGFTGEEEYNASSGCYRMKNRKIYDMPKE